MSTQPTVGEVAAKVPAAVRIFEKYKIDYCCGGQRPLAEACRERGISAEAVLAEVESSARQAGPASGWEQASLGALITHIVGTHHEYLKAELPLLSSRMEKVVKAHGEKHPEIVLPLQAALQALSDELLNHTRKEEMILFPAIQAMESAGGAIPLPFGTVQNPIRMMIFEHDNAGNALGEMRRLTGGYTPPADACPTFRALYQGLEELEADLHQHIHLENNILFPRAVELEGR